MYVILPILLIVAQINVIWFDLININIRFIRYIQIQEWPSKQTRYIDPLLF